MPDVVDHYRHAPSGAQTSPLHQQEVLSELLLSVPASVDCAVDVGSGRGANLELLATHASMVVAADVSQEALREASDRGGGSGRVAFVLLPGDRLPFATGSFSLTVCTEVLEHVADLGATAAELERITRPGGHLIVSTPNYRNVMGIAKWWMDRRSGREDWDPWHAHQGGLERFMTPARLRGAFRGSRVLDERGADYASALGIAWPPLRRRLNAVLLLGPGSLAGVRRLGMQYYLLLHREG